ncbi:MAG: hypothetical protein FD145_452 [Candidatus Saganbacteria bacterium]|uniref:Yip1 domain-containing protein n=1 Tax=Candidatus Saganbacteria bacterium TaxID=2575572 RepID=A0A833L1Y2_UNCSA|nr:MAG: hypothetical protein FD145_452 [Candidatus Saganbacteria bacterium]
MKYFLKARDIILYPVQTWEKIISEHDFKFLALYPVMLSIVQAVSIFIGYWLVGLRIGTVGYFRMSFINAFYSAVAAYILGLIGIIAGGFLILVIANYFSAECDIYNAMKLAVYSSSAPLLSGIFHIIPGVRILMILGLYGIYVLYIGLPKIIKTTHEKEQPLLFSSVISSVILMIIVNFLINQYIFGIVYSDILTY